MGVGVPLSPMAKRNTGIWASDADSALGTRVLGRLACGAVAAQHPSRAV